MMNVKQSTFYQLVKTVISKTGISQRRFSAHQLITKLQCVRQI